MEYFVFAFEICLQKYFVFEITCESIYTALFIFTGTACLTRYRLVSLQASFQSITFQVLTITSRQNIKYEYNKLKLNKLWEKPRKCPRHRTPHAAAQLQPIHALRLRRPARLAP